MIFLRSIPFLIREAFLNIRRQGLMTIASISTVAIALCIVGGFGLLAWQLRYVTRQLPRQFEVHAFTRTDLKPEEVERLREQVARLPDVRSVTLLSREDVWQQYRQSYKGLPSDLEGMENPMPAKLEIQAVTPDKTLAVAGRVRGLAGIDAVKDGATVLRRLIVIRDWVQLGCLILGALLALGAAAIISNAIRITLFARRREIRVMQLVGATNGFIRLPFLLEGMLDGLVGGGLACGLLYLGYTYLSNHVLVNIPLANEARFTLDLRVYLAAVTVGGVAVGFFGSMISVRRFLRI
jgi:cell division transport system permease protein